MKVLVLGSNGMIGRGVYGRLKNNLNIELHNFNRNQSNGVKLDLINSKRTADFIKDLKPDIIINCIGIIKQLNVEKRYLFGANSFFPHYLKYLSDKINSKLIQISTDCVFSGLKGDYNELDKPDPIDDYGKSKELGEFVCDNHLTIRTSVIGHEDHQKGLLEWFLNQESECHGYKNAIYTGLTASYFGEIIEKILISHPNLSGIIHISSEPISKFDLLQLIAEIYKKNIKIIPNDKIKIDRSLNCNKFKSMINFKLKTWSEMIFDMNKEFENAKK